MYSKSKGFTYQQTVPTPPPGYDGSRFRQRSDGRDENFPLYENQNRGPRRILTPGRPKTSDCPRCDAEDEAYEKPDDTLREDKEAQPHKDAAEEASPISLLTPILKSIGKEELLIIALIVLLAGEQASLDIDTILLLALLLCAG